MVLQSFTKKVAHAIVKVLKADLSFISILTFPLRRVARTAARGLEIPQRFQ